MKTFILRTIIINSAFLVSLTVFSQVTEKPYSGGIIAGSDRRFLISQFQQEPIRAKILSIDGDWISIKRRDGTTQKISRNTIKNIEEIPFGTIGSVGAGLGVPYGGWGVNLEMNVLPIISVSGGLGTTIFAGVGWSVGARGYFRTPGPVWRPRVSAFYGINAIYAEDFSDPSNRAYPGLTAGVGQIFLWQRHGFDLDLMYIVNSQYDDIHGGDYVKIKVNVGYRFAF